MTYKKEVRSLYQQIAKEMWVKAPPLKFRGGSKNVNATTGFKSIQMTKGLAKLVTKDKEVVETLIAHELTHFKYRDPFTKLKNLYVPLSRKFDAINLLFELRASIEGYSYNGIKSEAYILDVEKKFKDKKYQTQYSFSIFICSGIIMAVHFIEPRSFTLSISSSSNQKNVCSYNNKFKK